ncbi:hypothetical protein BMF77_02849 [Dolichospermum sp. UHCC 0315A]|jgi:hypothetical protein|nr:hypothetical protein BMF77_02849 [Dolichospermum sp. UHCC 0315A]
MIISDWSLVIGHWEKLSLLPITYYPLPITDLVTA